MTRSKKGNYYRLRTKKWLQEKGFTVETLERVLRIQDPKTKRILYIKRDIWASDLMAMNNEQLIYVNSVFGRKNIAAHIKEFLKHPFPTFVDLWLVVWEKGDHEPEIIEAR